MSKKTLDALFKPNAIAVIGATSSIGHVGYSVFKNLVEGGFKGQIYPVNIGKPEVQGVKAYPKVGDIPEKIDLAVIATPAPTVPGIVEECGKAGVKGIVIISAGFSEAGEEGRAMASQITESAKKYGIRVMGPNCLGFIAPKDSINATFASRTALPGNIAFVSQSGALCTSMLDWSVRSNIGFSYFVSIGSMIDIGFHDLIEYFGNDPGTKVIAIYMETLSNAKEFMKAASSISRKKPIVVLKAGKSSEAAKAAMSHTGSIAGNDSIFDAAFRRAGLIRAGTVEELFGCAKVFSEQELPKGGRLAIITNAGGPGVIATDALIEGGGELAVLSGKTLKKLNEILPASWSKGNPVDIVGDADPERYRKAVEACLEDKNIDAILVILTPQSMTNPSEVARQILSLKNRNKKAIFGSWMGFHEVIDGVHILDNGGIPTFCYPENAVNAFLSMPRFLAIKKSSANKSRKPILFGIDRKYARKIVENALKEKRNALTEPESKKLMACYKLPVPKSGVAKSVGEAEKVSKDIGFPVVMKILSPGILHKTDFGGVRLGINSPEEVRKVFGEIMASVRKKAPKAKIEGVLIEKFYSRKYELLIGCKRDSILGPAIVFGMGGTAVELLRDTNIELVPLNMALAKRLMEGTKVYKLLSGYRGAKGANIKELQLILCRFSRLVEDFPEIKEIDINPFAVDEKGGVALDVKVVLGS